MLLQSFDTIDLHALEEVDAVKTTMERHPKWVKSRETVPQIRAQNGANLHMLTSYAQQNRH